MKKSVFCAILAAMCMMSGCKGDVKKTDDTKPAATQSVKEDRVIATLNGAEITEGEFNFYLEGVKQQMMGTELSSDEDWETKEINGKKAIDVAKERAMENAVQNLSYKMIFEKLGNTISEEDKKAIDQQKEGIKSQYESNGGYDNFLKENNITDGFVDMLCESMFCSEKLYNDYTAEINPTTEELKAFYDEHFDEYFANLRRAKHVLIMTINQETNEPLPDNEKEEAKQKADDIYQRAMSGEDFDSLVEQYSEDPGSKSQPDGYVFGDGEMVQEFQDCVDSLKPGEIGFTETTYGYHIIKKLDVDLNMDEAKNRVSSRYVYEKFIEYIEQKTEEFGLKAEEVVPLSEI